MIKRAYCPSYEREAPNRKRKYEESFMYELHGGRSQESPGGGGSSSLKVGLERPGKTGHQTVNAPAFVVTPHPLPGAGHNQKRGKTR